MRTLKQLSTRLAATTLALGAGTLLVACGDNLKGDDGDDTPDMAIDSDTTMPDMMVDMPVPTVSATIAVSDVTVTTEEALAIGLRGASVSATFSDLTDSNGPEVLFGPPGAPIGSCLVTKFDADSEPNALLDAGMITIGPPEAPATSGLLKTMGPCNFVPAANSYLCASGAAAGATVAATDMAANGAVAYTFPTQDFTGQDLVGSYLQVNGFANTAFNSGASAFPIVAQANPTTLVVINPAPADAATETATSAASYTILNGFAPIPQPGAPFDNDFIGGADTSIRVQKAANGVWPAIDFTAFSRGQGFALDAMSDDPDGFPTTAEDLRFGCDNGTPADSSDDTCGVDLNPPPQGVLTAMILSGRATKRPLTGLAAYQMPAETPGGEWLEWQCAYLLNRVATMPAAAVQEIIDFEPTRIEMRVLFVSGALLNDGPNQARVLVGHGVVGHTTP